MELDKSIVGFGQLRLTLPPSSLEFPRGYLFVFHITINPSTLEMLTNQFTSCITVQFEDITNNSTFAR